MVTSSSSRTPSLFSSFRPPSSSASSASSSAAAAGVAAAAIAFLLLASIDQGSCSPTRFHHHRNMTSTVDDELPSSSSVRAANDSRLHLVLQHGLVRRGSGADAAGTPVIACYSCTYIFEEDYTTGVECNDPFSSDNIPEVMCPGSCHKLKKKLHQGGLLLVRGCLKSCHEKVDEHGYRHCCTSKLCNSSLSLNSINNAVKALCSTVLCLFLAVRLNSFV